MEGCVSIDYKNISVQDLQIQISELKRRNMQLEERLFDLQSKTLQLAKNVDLCINVSQNTLSELEAIDRKCNNNKPLPTL